MPPIAHLQTTIYWPRLQGCLVHDCQTRGRRCLSGSHLCLSMQALSKDVPHEELERAKNAAVSSILMNLESRAVVAEDIGRQIVTYGHRSLLPKMPVLLSSALELVYTGQALHGHRALQLVCCCHGLFAVVRLGEY